MRKLSRSYTYSSLPKADVFRYIVLHPGQDDEMLSCDIHTAPIAEAEFNCLSYVWGKSERDHLIICNGDEMLITRNLATALRHLRLPDRPLTLWADGICIDQESTQDKNHQVARMGKIYRAAQCVFLYMGLDEDNYGPTLCSLIDDVDAMIQDALQKGTVSWDSLPYPQEEDDPILDEDRWDSLYWLMSEEWFNRGWVVQEAALAREGQVIWGHSRFDWEKLMRTYIWLETAGREIHDSVSFYDVNSNAHVMAYLQTHEKFARAFCGDYMFEVPSVLRNLDSAKELDLSDPRDRIYAFTALPFLQVDVTPDYGTHFLDVFQQFAAFYIGSTKSVEILDFVHHNDQSITEGRSWVPRWDISKRALDAGLYPLLPRNKILKPPSIQGNCLTAHGVILDTVKYASKEFHSASTNSKTYQLLWQHIQKLSWKSSWLGSSWGDEGRLTYFLNALNAGRGLGEEWERSKQRWARRTGLEPYSNDEESLQTSEVPTSSMTALSIQDFAPSVDRSSSYLEDEDTEAGAEENDSEQSESEGPETNVYLRGIIRRTHGRRFILTERGYMGLVSLICQEGDLVAIIFGCQAPCILREVAIDSTCAQRVSRRFKFLGSTSLLGKIPVSSLVLGDESSKEWVDWDVEEQDIHLC